MKDPTARLVWCVSALGSAGLAALVAFTPSTVPVAVSLLAVLAIGLISIRMLTRSPTPVGGIGYSGSLERPYETSDGVTAIARWLYYGGALFVGILILRPAAGFTLSDWLFLGALGIVVGGVLSTGRSFDFLIPRAVVLGVCVFAAGGLISSFGAVSPASSVGVVVRMVYLTLAWFWLGTMLLKERDHVEIAVVAWVASAATSSAGAVAQFFLGDVIPGSTVHFGRMSGLTPHLNVLGGLTATALVPALMLMLDGRRRLFRIIGAGGTLLIGAGLILSGSVGGLGAAILGTMVWLAIRGLNVRLVAIGVALAVVAPVLLISATSGSSVSTPAQRVAKVFSEEEAQTGRGGTVHTRLAGWSDAWVRIREQPFVGVGLDEASSLAVTERAVHSMIVSPWFTAGLLGIVGVALLVVAAFRTGIRAVRDAPLETRSLAAALLASLATFAQFSVGEPILYVRYGWLPTALLIALVVQAERRRRGAGRPPSRARPLERALSAP